MTILDTAHSPNSVVPLNDTASKKYTYHLRRRAQEFAIQDPTGTHLKQALWVIVEPTESGRWVAYHPIIRTHGYGKTEIEAVRDFLDMMIGLFLELVESEEELAPHLRQELDYLREVIIEDGAR